MEDVRAAELTAKEEQTAGDGIYWPVFNLDRKNPRAKEDITHLWPDQLAESILGKEQRIAEIIGNIRNTLTNQVA